MLVTHALQNRGVGCRMAWDYLTALGRSLRVSISCRVGKTGCKGQLSSPVLLSCPVVQYWQSCRSGTYTEDLVRAVLHHHLTLQKACHCFFWEFYHLPQKGLTNMKCEAFVCYKTSSEFSLVYQWFSTNTFPHLVSVLSRKHYFCSATIKKILYFPSQKVRTSYFTGLFDVVMFC